MSKFSDENCPRCNRANKRAQDAENGLKSKSQLIDKLNKEKKSTELLIQRLNIDNSDLRNRVSSESVKRREEQLDKKIAEYQRHLVEVKSVAQMSEVNRILKDENEALKQDIAFLRRMDEESTSKLGKLAAEISEQAFTIRELERDIERLKLPRIYGPGIAPCGHEDTGLISIGGNRENLP